MKTQNKVEATSQQFTNKCRMLQGSRKLEKHQEAPETRELKALLGRIHAGDSKMRTKARRRLEDVLHYENEPETY